MRRTNWKELFEGQPPGLSSAELSRRIRQPPQQTHYWVKRLKYACIDGRKCPSPDKFNKLRKVNMSEIDWTETNNRVLADRHGISRERIRQLRKKVPKTC